MKQRRWLNVTEYLMLAGAGVGSVATAFSQQFLFAAAPLSALFVLNLLNHRRLEQTTHETTDLAVSRLDHKVSNAIAALQQQVQALPSPLHLATLRKDLQSRNQQAFQELAQNIQQLQQQTNNPEWRFIPQELSQLQEQYALLADTLSGMRSDLDQLTPATKLENFEAELTSLKTELAQLSSSLNATTQEAKASNIRGLQDQITHLNRRLNNLPAPFDSNSLRQQVESLIKVMGDMANRRDLSRLEAQLEKLVQQNEDIEQTVTPLKVVTNIMRKQVDTVTTRLNVFEEMLNPASLVDISSKSSVLEALKVTVNDLEQKINGLPEAFDWANLRSELQELVTDNVEPLQHQLEAVQQQAYDLDQQHKTLRDWVQRLPELLNTSALQHEVKYLSTRVEWAESSLAEIQAREEWGKASAYELVFDVAPQPPHAIDELASDDRPSPAMLASVTLPTGGSRAVLERSLAETQGRLIVVYPFPSATVLDSEMLEKFRQFLDRKGCLDIGWGHLEQSDQPVPRSIDRRRTITPTSNAFLYNILNQLTELKKHYPDQFRFKVLGTDEYFLVCDRSYAVLGTDSLSMTSVAFPEAAMALRTTEKHIIQALVERFDNPTLAPDDVLAYFNRAATRYDLGDHQGAITDYTEVLTIDPENDVAFNNRGLVRYDLSDKQGAIADFSEAISYNPQNYLAYSNRGYVRSELGDKLGAIEDYTFAIQLNPDHATAYFYRGLARTRMQNKLGAIEDYTEVLRLNPQDASAYFYRGLASAKIGQRMEAVRDLRQAAQLFANQGDSVNYQQTINAIKKLHKTMVIGAKNQPLVSNGA